MGDKKENKYVAIWMSYESYFEPLSAAEVGRLVLAMMKYKSSGAEPKLSGNERYVWPAIRRDMDASEAKQREKSETNRQNALKKPTTRKTGASDESEHKRTAANQSEHERTVANESEHMQTEAKGAIEKDKEKEKEIEKERATEKGNTADACAESAGGSPPAISLLLNDGTEYPVSPEQCREWAALYPAVDVMQELRKMVGWLQANSAKRKTRRGILRFITNWLSREQDKGPRGSEWNPASGRAAQGSSGTAMDDLRELHQMFGEEDGS